MGASFYFLLFSCTCILLEADGRKTYRDMFPHKHPVPGKLPFPIPPIPGWDPDTNPWDDYLYPPFGPKPKELTHRGGKPVKVRLTSDSPAISGSLVSFTAKLEYPPCQKEDGNGDLVWDEHCNDANGQVRSGYVYNWTSWMDDYGFGKCTDLKRCNAFPDGKPFPQSNDWRRKSYVYVWHTMGQYYETCDGSSSSLTLNTTNITLGAEVMEVMVYRKRERRKYSPLSTDNTVFFVTDKIPLAVNISQKAAANLSENVFFRDEDVVFSVAVHDPSSYLKTADSVNFIWDFSDGNHLVTHSNVATHAYSSLGKLKVMLSVKANFQIECPTPSTTVAPVSPITPTEGPTPPPETHAITSKMETTQAPGSTTQPSPYTSSVSMTTGFPTTEPFLSTENDVTLGPNDTTTAPLHIRRQADDRKCYRYLYGNFTTDITIIERKHALISRSSSRILGVSAAKETNADISFLVKCFGSTPTIACTIVSDYTCKQVSSIVCDDVPASPHGCEVHLRRTFREPGTYCVNITLEDSSSMALASTTVTIDKAQDVAASKSHTVEVVLSTSVMVVAAFAFIAFLVYKRYKVYQPIRRTVAEEAADTGVPGPMGRLRNTLFSSSEESRYLLTNRHPL